MTPELLAAARAAKGFMPDDEGLALHEAGKVAAATGLGPLLEVGSYCGKSGIYLGAAAREHDTVLFTVDHHRGSEENQAGWEHHDPDVVDPRSGRMDTLPCFRRTIEGAQLEDCVIAVIGTSTTVARWWSTPLALLFVDGGHGDEVVRADERAWVPHVAPGGLIAVHDVFPDPADGGRPPYELWCRLLDSGQFTEDAGLSCGSLRVARRAAAPPPPRSVGG
ncbi:MAG: 1-O-methyltransferase [Acidimicrobiaceae bacterium]|nr:1-O-methyltransferase [Acidimicrobiaceae bacterium]